MDKGTMYFGGIMIAVIFGVSIINSYLATFLPPQLVQQIGGGMMLVLMIGSIAGLEAYYILHTSAFTHYQMLVRPFNEIVELFVDDRRVESTLVGNNLWSSIFPLVFPRRIKSYGNVKINRLRILHEYEKGQRFDLRPGRASLDDYDFNHPQTEFIEVVQIPAKSTSIDRAEVIPEYKLLTARNDYKRSFVSAAQFNTVKTISTITPAKNDPPEDPIEVTKLETALAQQKSETEYWHQQAISTEQWVEQQRTETRGLLGAMNSITAYAIEFLLQLVKAFGSVDGALTHLRGTTWDRWGKWVFITAIACFAIFYLWSNPQILNGIYQWFSDPTHQVTIILVAAVALGATYLILRKKK